VSDVPAPEPQRSSPGTSPTLAPRRQLFRALLAVSASVLTTLIGTQCLSDVFQPVPNAPKISLTITPTDSVLVSIGDQVVPFAGTLLVDGSPTAAAFHLHLIVQPPDTAVVTVVESQSAAPDALYANKRGSAVVGVVPVSSMITGDPTPVTRRVRAVVPILAPDTSRTATSPRAKTFVSFGDTLTLKACGFTLTWKIGCNPTLPVTWSVTGGTGAAALRNAATGLIQAVSNGTATFTGSIDAVTTSWTVTVGQVARRVRSVSGSAQTDTISATLSQPFVVQVSDANDSTARIAGVQVGWKVGAGGGTFVGGTDTANTTTDANGQASVALRLGTAGSQTVTASLSNLLGSKVTFAATAYLPHPPATPTTPLQYTSDCATGVSVGSTTDDLSACFTATVTDPDPGAMIRLAVEVQPVGTAFTGTPTAVGTAVASAGTASVTVPGLHDDAGYHWQYWAIDQSGRVSAVTSFGGNAETAADFTVSRTTIVLSAVTVAFTASQGGGNPASQTVSVTSGGGSLRGLTVGAVSYGAGSGWLTTATLSSANAPATLTLKPVVGTLTAGTYTASVPITSNYAKNSPQTVTVTFTVTAPDLVVTALSSSPSAPVGGSIDVHMTVTNQGSGDAARFRVGYYWSTSSTVTTSSVNSGWLCNVASGLAAGASLTCAGTISVLNTLTPNTTYYLGAIADDSAYILESNKTNNTRTVTTWIGPSQLIVNGGFEDATTSPWTLNGNNVWCSGEGHSGTHDMWVGGVVSGGLYCGVNNNTSGYVSQSITVPPGSVSDTLSFYYNITTFETSTSTQYDYLQAQILDASGNVVAYLPQQSNLDANTSWTRRAFSLAPYAGQTVTVKFWAVNNATYTTTFRIDDVSVTWSAGPAPGPPANPSVIAGPIAANTTRQP
jgi:hypothetical protein